MASPEPEDSWSNHIHTHTHARTHTHSHTGARRARLILAGARKKNYVYPPSLRSMLYIFFSFLQRMDWSFKKCCRVRARRRRCAEGEGAFAELCSSVRGAGRPCPPARPPARPPAVASAAAAAAAAPWPRPPRAPPRPLAARPRPRRALEWGRPGRLPPAPSPESRSPTERRGQARAGEGEDRGGRAAKPGGDRHPATRLGRGAGSHTARPSYWGPLPRLEPGEAQPVTSERPLLHPASLGEFR